MLNRLPDFCQVAYLFVVWCRAWLLNYVCHDGTVLFLHIYGAFLYHYDFNLIIIERHNSILI